MNYSNACLQKVQFKLLQVSIHINNWRIIPHAPYHHVTIYIYYSSLNLICSTILKTNRQSTVFEVLMITLPVQVPGRYICPHWDEWCL